MSQNRSSAVMQQRAEPHDSLDDFPTPPWAARALCEHVIATDSDHDTVWEPACNRGFLARGLEGYFRSILSSDIHDYSDENPGQHRLQDFLIPWADPPHVIEKGVDWIITNPPFRLAEQFATRGLEIARKGVALLVRSAFVEGVGRHERLFSRAAPLIVAQFTERVPMVKGRCDPAASTATAYCWIVWVPDRKQGPTEFVWIPPCRRQLERTGDYELGVPA